MKKSKLHSWPTLIFILKTNFALLEKKKLAFAHFFLSSGCVGKNDMRRKSKKHNEYSINENPIILKTFLRKF